LTNAIRTQPDFKFLHAHFAHFFALGFGSGLAPKAPGTAGTLVAFPLYWLIRDLSLGYRFTIVTLLFGIGIYFCSKTNQSLGVADHGSIVWDEIVAMMMVLTFTPRHWAFWILAFALFRLFDIWKPFPIKQCDAKFKNGFGVMFDDILAAIYAILCMQVMVLWLISKH